ncbi:MAG: hypothetical protein ACTHJ4_07185 [Candidatus Nucleicultricaceae bacterium]
MNYFTSRSNYKISEAQAWYENEATGVYFSFNVGDEYDLEFNINFCRPHYFGLEAAKELSEFFINFPSTIIDPQAENTTEKFDEQSFLNNWLNHNTFACRAAKPQLCLSKYKPLSTSLLDQFWKWNYSIDNLVYTTLSNLDVYISPLHLYQESNLIKPLSFWPDGISIVLPRDIDIIISKKKIFRKTSKYSIIKYSSISKVLEKYQHPKSNENYIILYYDNMPKDIGKIFSSLLVDTFNSEYLLDRNLLINEEFF